MQENLQQNPKPIHDKHKKPKKIGIEGYCVNLTQAIRQGHYFNLQIVYDKQPSPC